MNLLGSQSPLPRAGEGGAKRRERALRLAGTLAPNPSPASGRGEEHTR